LLVELHILLHVLMKFIELPAELYVAISCKEIDRFKVYDLVILSAGSNIWNVDPTPGCELAQI
jgi:hypothetical protein